MDLLPKIPTGDATKDADIEKLHSIVKQEKSHGQWKK
jgi:hypothetical protein